MAWYDHSWVIAVATLAGVAVFYRQLRSMSKKNEFDSLQRAGEILAQQFSKVDGGAARFYALRHRFKDPGDRSESDAANPEWGVRAYKRALLKRVSKVAELSPESRDDDLAAARPVVNALNDLAELIDLDFLDAPLVLSKYHLLLAREAFILEPYIYYEVLFADRGRWGFRVLRLGEMARKYNDINPVHRRPIYFLDGDRPDTDFGAIYLAPDSRFLWLLKTAWLVRRQFGYPTITERVKRRQNRQLGSIADRTHHLGRRKDPPATLELTRTDQPPPGESPS